MLKNFLNEANIPFKEVNVETQPDIMQKIVSITGQMGVPQTEINGTWVIGYDPNSIMQVLKG